MRFVCEQNELNVAVTNVSGAVPQKSNYACLEGIKMYLDGNSLELTGYDMELGIRTKVEVASEDHGEFIVDSKLFCDIIRKMPSGKVSVDIDEKLRVTIKGGDAEYNILALPADDYPDMPDYDTSDSFTVSQAVLKNMIEQTVYAAAVTDNKPILMGELFDISDGIFNLVAIDGYRMAIRTEAVKTDDRYHFVVKAKTMKEVQKILSDDDDKKVNIYASKKHVVFEIDGYLVSSRLLEGEYHNYKGSLPSSFSTEIIISTKNLIASLERSSLLIDDNTKCPVRCSFGDRSVKIVCNTPKGKLSDEFPIDNKGGNVDIGFNCKYLLEALKATESDKVRFLLNGPLSPMKVVPCDGDSFTFLVLPVRLKD